VQNSAEVKSWALLLSWVVAMQDARASLDATIPALSQNSDSAKLSYFFGIVTLNSRAL